MRVCVDTDVILDYLLERSDFIVDAAIIWEANSTGRIDGYIAAITPVNVYYIARRLRGEIVAREVVTLLMNEWQVCTVSQEILNKALHSELKDFEDAVQEQSALANNIKIVITRNKSDYRNAHLTVMSPVDFTAYLNS